FNLEFPLLAALLLFSPAPPLPPVHPAALSAYSALLMWHDVVERKKEVWFDTTVAELEAQFRSIKQRGLQPITLDRLAEPLEKELGGSRPYFAYPEGHYDARIARAVLKAGYRLGITEDWGAAERSPNLMMVHRYSMHRRARQAVEDVARAARGRLQAAPTGS